VIPASPSDVCQAMKSKPHHNRRNFNVQDFAIITLLGVILFLTGCGMSSSGTHTVSTEYDSFTEEIDGRKIEFHDWTIKIDDKEIPIEKKKSVIKIDTTASGKVDIFVNGELVHDE
jgi:hypothetical protein